MKNTYYLIRTSKLLCLYILFYFVQTACPFPKHVWTFWSNKQKQPFMAKQIISQFQQVMSRQPEWTFNIANTTNYKEHLPQTYKQFQKDLDRLHNKTMQATANLFRLHVLSARGGVWIDATTLFIQGLQWLEQLNNNTKIINRDPSYSNQPDVLLFYWSRHQYSNNYLDKKGFIGNYFPAYQNWFIASKKNSTLINEWKQKYAQTYLNVNVSQCFERIQKYNIFLQGFKYEVYHRNYYSLYQLLTLRQKQLDSGFTVQQLFNRKNVNIYYKIWTIQSTIGPFLSFDNFRFRLIGEIVMFKYNLEQLTQVYNTSQIKYFIKWTRVSRNQITKLLSEYNKTVSEQKTLIQLFNQNKQKNNSFNCADMFFVSDDSFAYTHLFKQTNTLKGIKIFTLEQKQHFNNFCKQFHPTQDPTKQFFLNSLIKNTKTFLIKLITNQKKLFFPYFLQLAILASLTIKLFKYGKENGREQFTLKNDKSSLQKICIYCPIDKICLWFIKTTNNRINLIPYLVVYYCYIYCLFIKIIQNQRNNQRQKYEQLFQFTVAGCLLHKLYQIKFLQRKQQTFVQSLLLDLPEQLLFLGLAKLTIQLISNSWIYRLPLTIFFGYSVPRIIKSVTLVKTNIPTIDKFNQFMKGKHFFIVMIISSVIGQTNTGNIYLYGSYIRLWLLKFAIIYSIFLTGFVIYSFSYSLCKKYCINDQTSNIAIERLNSSILLSKKAMKQILISYWVFIIIYFYHLQQYQLIYGQRQHAIKLSISIFFFLVASCQSTIHIQHPRYDLQNDLNQREIIPSESQFFIIQRVQNHNKLFRQKQKQNLYRNLKSIHSFLLFGLIFFQAIIAFQTKRHSIQLRQYINGQNGFLDILNYMNSLVVMMRLKNQLQDK